MTADHAGQTGGEREVCGHVPQPAPMYATRPVSCVESGEHEWHRDGGVHWNVHVIWYDGDDAVPTPSRPVPPAGQADEAARVAFRRWYAQPVAYMDYETAFRAGWAARGEAPLGAALEEVTDGQAAREAAVEAVARRMCIWHDGNDAWDEHGDIRRDEFRADARELLSLPEVAALSAAPGQVWGRYGTEPDSSGGQPADVHSATPGQEPLVEWSCPNCGATTRARMADHPGQEQGR